MADDSDSDIEKDDGKLVEVQVEGDDMLSINSVMVFNILICANCFVFANNCVLNIV